LELVTGCPFKIYGVMKAKFLSPDTQYSAYVVKFGEFLNDGGFMDDRDEIRFHITEIKYTYWKYSFIIQGTEFRPVQNLGSGFGW
ncbi:unnamed protein product, partial [Brassica oleracea var. botrytis]